MGGAQMLEIEGHTIALLLLDSQFYWEVVNAHGTWDTRGDHDLEVSESSDWGSDLLLPKCWAPTQNSTIFRNQAINL